MTTEQQPSKLHEAVCDFPEAKYQSYESNADRLSQLMQRIDHSESDKAIAAQPSNKEPRLLDRLNDWFFGGANMPIRAFAGVSFVAALALGITLLVQTPTRSGFELASGGAPVSASGQYQYIIGFSEEATLKVINGVFEQLDAVSISGPDNQVLYTVSTNKVLTEEQIVAIEDNALVEFFGKAE